jgi:hypothetical protein
MTAAEAFLEFKSELELPDKQQKLAALAQQEIRTEIAKRLPVYDSFLTGSYARYTKIDPLNDIDIMLVRNYQRTGLSTGGGGTYPSQALDEVLNALQSAYPHGMTAKKQSRSVNVQFVGLEFGFDIIPAWLRSPDGYWIPDTDSSNWIPTDPEAHAKIMTTTNDQCNGKLKPIVKMAKHWNRNNYELINSFHLELICADIFSREELTNFPISMATVLVRLPHYLGQQVMDPIYGSSRIDKQLPVSELGKLLSRVNYDGQNAVEALRLESTNRHLEAIAKWKHIFISGFPR